MSVRQIGRECTAFLQPNSQSPRAFIHYTRVSLSAFLSQLQLHCWLQ